MRSSNIINILLIFFLLYIFYNKNKKLDYKYNLIDKNYNKLIENI